MSDCSKRPIRSFVLRQGRMTDAQKRDLAELWPIYGVQDAWQPVHKPTILEIGFGMGSGFIEMAKNYPEYEFIGIEVHQPGVASALRMADAFNLKNIQIYQKDAIDVLSEYMTDKSLDQISLFFPDPWPKKRHHKRRMIQPSFLDLLVLKLKPSGLFHFATDWGDYAEHVIKVFDQDERFTVSKAQLVRPETKFERRGVKLGHQIVDLVFSIQQNNSNT